MPPCDWSMWRVILWSDWSNANVTVWLFHSGYFSNSTGMWYKVELDWEDVVLFLESKNAALLNLFRTHWTDTIQKKCSNFEMEMKPVLFALEWILKQRSNSFSSEENSIKCQLRLKISSLPLSYLFSLQKCAYLCLYEQIMLKGVLAMLWLSGFQISSQHITTVQCTQCFWFSQNLNSCWLFISQNFYFFKI